MTIPAWAGTSPAPTSGCSGKIRECHGTIAFGETLCQCQSELRSVLEGWLLVKIRHGDHLPVMDGLDLNRGIPILEETAAHG